MTSSKRARPSERHVALLRGINVGGKNKLPMAALRELCVQVGCDDVRTYIQSGNVVVSARAGVLAGLARALPRAIREAFGLEVPVVMRSAAEWLAVVSSNPFLKAGNEPETLHVAFLAAAPSRAGAAALDPERSPGDAFVLRGRDLYLHFPNGVAGTKLTSAYLDRTLGTISTVRNWRTVLQLQALLKD